MQVVPPCLGLDGDGFLRDRANRAFEDDPIEEHILLQELGVSHPLGGFDHAVLDEVALAVQDQHVPLIDALDFIHARLPLFLGGAVDQVRAVLADERLVGRDGDDFELVDLPELVGLGHGRARHAGQLLVHAEEVLQRDRGQRLRLLLDADAVARVFGLDGLVQPVGPLPAVHQAAGELVDDNHDLLARLLVVHHRVLLVLLVEVMCAQGVVDQVRPFHVAGRVKALDAGQLLGLADALVGEVAGVLLLLDLEVPARLALLQVGQLDGDVVGLGVAAHVSERLAGDDERRAGLVDEDVVHFIDDRVVEGALTLVVPRVEVGVAPAGRLHVVAQVVEAELAVRAVSDVAVVGLVARGGIHVALDEAGRDAQGPVDRRHPFAVAAGEVVVDGDDVDALARQRIEVRRQRGDEGLAFAGHHFGDVAAVQDDAAEDLRVEVPHVLGAAAGLAAGGERLGQDVFQRRAVGQALLERWRQVAQLLVRQGAHLLFEAVDLVEERAGLDDGCGPGRLGADVAQVADVPLVAGPEEGHEPAADGVGKARELVAQLVPETQVHVRVGSHRVLVMPFTGSLPAHDHRTRTEFAMLSV